MSRDIPEAPKRGRKPAPKHLKRIDCHTRQPRWLVEWMESQPTGKGALIESALIKAFGLNPPKG